MTTEIEILTKAVDKGCGVMEKVSHRLWDREDLVQAESASRFRDEDSLDAPSDQIEISSLSWLPSTARACRRGKLSSCRPNETLPRFRTTARSHAFTSLLRFLGGPSHLKPLTSDQSPSHNDDKT
jgi:hypothetical protein